MSREAEGRQMHTVDFLSNVVTIRKRLPKCQGEIAKFIFFEGATFIAR